jgi:hypothetical protein
MNHIHCHAILGVSSLCLASVGCGSSLTVGSAHIREADPERVGQCAFLGTVVGHAGSFDSSPVHDAQTEALNAAAEKGATRVVWVSLSVSRGATAFARAYQCSGG